IKSRNSSVTGLACGIGTGPPASPINTNLAPPGPTSKTSMLSGNMCHKPLSVTRMPPATFGAPATNIFDGYGTAGPLSVMSIGAPLQNRSTGDGDGDGVGVGVRVGDTLGVGVGVGVRVGLGTTLGV